MIRPLLITAFVFGVIFLPWWAVLVFGTLLIACSRDYALVIAGGLLFDAIYGAPIIPLSDLTFLYTSVFAILITIDLFLRNRLMD